MNKRMMRGSLGQTAKQFAQASINRQGSDNGSNRKEHRMIQLKERRQEFVDLATKAFQKIISYPGRTDEKERTGIQVLVHIPGTRNRIFFPVGNPSEDAMFFSAEKAVRSHTLAECASQNSESPGEMKFRGSITVELDGTFCQASVSGLKGEEDVAVAIAMLSLAHQTTKVYICNMVRVLKGELPECLTQSEHYLYSFMRSDLT